MKRVAAVFVLGLVGCSAGSDATTDPSAAVTSSKAKPTKQLCSTEFKDINYEAAINANAELTKQGVQASDVAFTRQLIRTETENGLERTVYKYIIAINAGAIVTRSLIAKNYEVNDPNTSFADKQYPNEYTSCNYSSGYASNGYVVSRSSQVTLDEAKTNCQKLSDGAAEKGKSLAIGAVGQSGLYPKAAAIAIDDTLSMRLGISMDTDGTFSYPTLSNGTTEASAWSSVVGRCKSQLGTTDSKYPYLGYGDGKPTGTPELGVCLDVSSWLDFTGTTDPGLLYVDVSSASMTVPFTIWKNQALATVSSAFAADDGTPGVVNVKVPDVAVPSSSVSTSVASICGWDKEADAWGDNARDLCASLQTTLKDEFSARAKGSMTAEYTAKDANGKDYKTTAQKELASALEKLVAGVMLETESAALVADTSSTETIKLDSKASIKDVNYNIDGWILVSYEATSCSSTSSAGTMPVASHKCDADFKCSGSNTQQTDNQGCVHMCMNGIDAGVIKY